MTHSGHRRVPGRVAKDNHVEPQCLVVRLRRLHPARNSSLSEPLVFCACLGVSTANMTSRRGLLSVSTWPFADAVSHRNGEKISSGPTSPALGSKRADYFAAAQIDLPTPQPALSPEPPVADAAIDEKSTAGLDPATSSVGQAERLVVRLAANIRSEPSSKSTLIGTAHVGAELEVAERQARWVRFVDPATSHTGWIYEGLLTPLRSEYPP